MNVVGNSPHKKAVCKGKIFSNELRRFCSEESRFTDSQIMAVLKHAEGCTPVLDLCRKHGISNATFYKRRAKFGGMDVSLMTTTDGEDERTQG